MSYVKTEDTEELMYRTGSGKEIKSKKTVKDLGVWTEDASFEEHFD